MDVAVVISVHNENNLRFKNCLRTLLYQETTHDYGVYIVDYASTDNLQSMLQELGSDKLFYVYVDKEPLNKAHANNIAIQSVDANIICFLDPYCIVPMQTIEAIYTHAIDEGLMLYIRKPYFVPEPMWQNLLMTPEDFEQLRTQDTQVLNDDFDIGIGPHKKQLYAIKRDRLVEIRGFDEQLSYGEDTDVIRRLLLSGNILIDLSQYIDIAYQPSVADREGKSEIATSRLIDVRKSENAAILKKSDPLRNLNTEWGAL